MGSCVIEKRLLNKVKIPCHPESSVVGRRHSVRIIRQMVVKNELLLTVMLSFTIATKTVQQTLAMDIPTLRSLFRWTEYSDLRILKHGKYTIWVHEI